MKAKTYQIAKDNLKALVDSECSETAVVENDACLFGSLLADTSPCRYVMFDAPYIHRIHKPVVISTDKLGE